MVLRFTYVSGPRYIADEEPKMHAEILSTMIARLLATTELNMDDLEPETKRLIEEAQELCAA